VQKSTATRQEQDYYQRFIDSLSKSPQTQKKYIQEFNYFLKWLKVNDANDLIAPSLLDSQAEIRKVEDTIIGYIKHLSQVEKLSYSSIHVRVCAIMHFYSINRVHIDRTYISKFKPQNKKIRKGDLAYTHEQIQRMLDSSNSDLRARAIILLMSSTGMRIGALPTLTVGSLTKVELNDYPGHIYKIKVYEQEQEQYYTFCTIEAAEAIDRYLRYRAHFGEQITRNSPLFREEFDFTNPLEVKRPRFLSDRSFHSIIDRSLIVSGIKSRVSGTERNLHDIMASHGLRKFAITQMKKARVDFSDREYMVGHKSTRGLDNNYDRTAEVDRLAEYLKAMDLLTISPENRLRKRVAEQDYTIQVELAQQRKQNEALHKRMKVMEQYMELYGHPEFRDKLEKGVVTSKSH
jgi:integrase